MWLLMTERIPVFVCGQEERNAEIQWVCFTRRSEDDAAKCGG